MASHHNRRADLIFNTYHIHKQHICYHFILHIKYTVTLTFIKLYSKTTLFYAIFTILRYYYNPSFTKSDTQVKELQKEKLGFYFQRRVEQTFYVKGQMVNILGVAGHIQSLSLPPTFFLTLYKKNPQPSSLTKNRPYCPDQPFSTRFPDSIKSKYPKVSLYIMNLLISYPSRMAFIIYYGIFWRIDSHSNKSSVFSDLQHSTSSPVFNPKKICTLSIWKNKDGMVFPKIVLMAH